ncbi:MAG TPA: hypothetical protein VL461_12100 [Dictyobacter sp.]|jgi:hypothetical protein|nr:hypothetical protein [Dictyobacter sp.]
MQQQERPRYLLVRRLLFPYSGEEPLTQSQAARVILSWATIFPVALTVGTLPCILVFGSQASGQRVALLLLMAFVVGVAIFSVLAWFVVFMINRSARFMQQQRVQKSYMTDDPSGGRYGS